jgi:hypothetical protein
LLSDLFWRVIDHLLEDFETRIDRVDRCPVGIDPVGFVAELVARCIIVRRIATACGDDKHGAQHQQKKGTEA